MTSKKKARIGLAYNSFFGAIAGGIPDLEVIKPESMNVETVIEAIKPFDLIVFSGGEDINPRYYGESPTFTTYYNETRDGIEGMIGKLALKMGIKTFGICRGHQLLAALTGGMLWQDIGIQEGSPGHHSGNHALEFIAKHPVVEVLQGMGIDRVNSMHHQGIRRVGSNTYMIAMYKDLPEICVGQNNTMLSVQWHPEFMEGMDTFFKYVTEDWVFDKNKSNGELHNPYISKKEKISRYEAAVQSLSSNSGTGNNGHYSSPSGTSNNSADPGSRGRGIPFERMQQTIVRIDDSGNPVEEVMDIDPNNLFTVSSRDNLAEMEREEDEEMGDMENEEEGSMPLDELSDTFNGVAVGTVLGEGPSSSHMETFMSGTHIAMQWSGEEAGHQTAYWRNGTRSLWERFPIEEQANEWHGIGDWEMARENLNYIVHLFENNDIEWDYIISRRSAMNLLRLRLGVPELLFVFGG